MDNKFTFAQSLYEGLSILIIGIGLTLDPVAFVGCVFLASSSSFVAKGLDPMVGNRRGFWLTLATSLLFSLMLLLLNDSMTAAKEWWPHLSPQFVAIVGGLFGPFAVPLLLRRFPALAERLVGHVFPEKK